jgi:hypothetical protein
VQQILTSETSSGEERYPREDGAYTRQGCHPALPPHDQYLGVSTGSLALPVLPPMPSNHARTEPRSSVPDILRGTGKITIPTAPTCTAITHY